MDKKSMIEALKKSNVRLKVVAFSLAGWASAVGIAYSHNLILDLLLLVIFAFFSVAFLFIRCERCGALAYRFDKKDHGFPHYRALFPPMSCPSCGLERK